MTIYFLKKSPSLKLSPKKSKDTHKLRDYWIFYTKNRSEEWGFFHNYYGISWQCKIIYSSLIREKKIRLTFSLWNFQRHCNFISSPPPLRSLLLAWKKTLIFFHSDVYYFGMENKVGKQKKRNNLAWQNKVAPWHNK